MDQPIPTFDEDGYPTDHTLAVIRTWPISRSSDAEGFLEYCKRAWRYDFIVATGEEDGKKWIKVATHGWSGNEDLIRAMEDNYMFWALCWLESSRGGGYKFLIG